MKHRVTFKYRFELLIPLRDNKGRAFSWAMIEGVIDVLSDRFGGCRCQPFSPMYGSWEHRGKRFQEELLMFIADAPHSDGSLSWMLAYKHRLKRQFQQIEIYLAVTEIFWL